jgi:hypothetical protein
MLKLWVVKIDFKCEAVLEVGSTSRFELNQIYCIDIRIFAADKVLILNSKLCCVTPRSDYAEILALHLYSCTNLFCVYLAKLDYRLDNFFV